MERRERFLQKLGEKTPKGRYIAGAAALAIATTFFDGESKDKNLENKSLESIEELEKNSNNQNIQDNKNLRKKKFNNDSIKKKEEEEIGKRKVENFERFASILKNKDLNYLHRETDLGKFVRTFRYIEQIKENANKYNVPIDTLIALIMMESRGDPMTFNDGGDGGAGLCQIQGFTAKKADMDIFSDLDKYSEYNPKSYSDENHGSGIKKFLNDYNYNLSEVSKIDDRFHPNKCIDYMSGQLKNYYDFYDNNPELVKENANSSKWKKAMEKYGYENFKWMLAVNAYNKGGRTGGFDNFFVEGGHVDTIYNYMQLSQKYGKIIHENFGESFDKIMKNITGIDNPEMFVTVGENQNVKEVLEEANRIAYENGERVLKTEQQMKKLSYHFQKDVDYIHPGETIKLDKKGNEIIITYINTSGDKNNYKYNI